MRKKSVITKLIIVVVIILVAFIGIKLTIFINQKLHEDKPDSIAPEIQDEMNSTSGKIQKVGTPNEIYQVKSCILKYYLNYAAIFGENTITQTSGEVYNKEEYIDTTYNMIAPQYIQKNSFLKNNLSENYNDISEPEIEIYSIYSVTQYSGVVAYFTNGAVRDTISNKSKEFNFIVVLDDVNKTFEIYLDNYLDISDFNNLKENETIEFDLPTEVENRSSNVYGAATGKYEQVASDYFNLIRKLMLYDTSKAYDFLTDEMKQKYVSENQFEEYVKDNYKKIFLLSYSNYYTKNNNGNMIFKTYNTDDSICINIYFDEFTSFKFDIEYLN